MILPDIVEYNLAFGHTHIIIDLILIFGLFFFILDGDRCMYNLIITDIRIV